MTPKVTRMPAFFSGSLPVDPAHHRHQLRDLFSLIRLVAARDRVFDAMGNVVFQHFFLEIEQICQNLGLRQKILATLVPVTDSPAKLQPNIF